MDSKVFSLIGLAIGLVMLLYVVANTFPNSLGTIANSTSGSAMTNVDAGTKGLYGLIPLFSVIAIVIGVAFAAMSMKSKN